MRRSARSQPIPPDEVTYLLSLQVDMPTLKSRCYSLYMAGWTLSAIGEPLRRARSTVRSWVLSGPYPVEDGVPIPVDKTYVRRRPPSPGLDAPTVNHLSALGPVARTYRSRFAESHTATQANRELTSLTRQLHEQGVSIQELADATGVTYRAMYRRVRDVR